MIESSPLAPIEEVEAELRRLASAGGARSLPVIQRPIDNTALSAYQACPREYLFSMVQHRRGDGKSPPLVFGSAWHAALEAHYRTPGTLDDRMAAVFEAVMKKWEGDEHYTDYRNRERVFVEYQKYIKFYGDIDKDPGKTVGFPDHPLLEMPVNAVGGALLHPYAGKIDRVIEMDGLYYVEDHKTTSRFDKYYFQQYERSNQMMGYVYMASMLMPNIKISGVRINLLHVLTDKSNFYREIVPFSREMLDEWAENTNRWLLRIARDHEAGDFPGHFGDNGCSRKFGLCQYFRVCSAAPRIRDRLLELEYPAQHPWNPLNVGEEG